MWKTKRLPNALVLAVVLVGVFACANNNAAKDPPAEGASASSVAARVGDTVITLEQVDQKARATNMQAYQQLYDARKAAVDELVADELLAREAKSRGVTTEELVDTEITQKIKPVTDADIEAYYNQQKARMGNRTFDQVKGQIKGFLENQNKQQPRLAFLSSLKANADIRVTLDPPRAIVEVAENAPRKGNANAVVQIVEFSEFQ